MREKPTTNVFFIFFVCIFVFSSWGPCLYARGGSIKGSVKAEDGSILPGVLVFINDTHRKTLTNDQGEYVLNSVGEGNLLINASLEGFDLGMEPVHVVDGKTVTVNFILKTKSLSYDITVKKEPVKLMTASKNIGAVSIKPEQLATLPGLGEQDIFRSMQFMPGISASSESSSGLYVRGGKPDQNLISFDGFTIYHVDHFFGIFSAFNANAIDEIKLLKGGFESKYGGRLSSVMELSGKTGNEEQFKAGVGANFLSFNGFAEIPLGNKGAIFLAGRKSFQSPLYDKILDKYGDTGTSIDGQNSVTQGPGGRGRGMAALFNAEPTSYFYDLNAKAIFKPSTKDILTFSFYNGKDDVDNSRDIEIPSFMAEKAAARGFSIDVEGDYIDLTDWGNTGLSLNWMRQWNDNFSTTTTFAYSRFFSDKELNSTMKITRSTDSETDETEVPEENPPPRNTERMTNENNTLGDLTIKMDNFLGIARNHRVEFGFQLTANTINYAYSATNFRRPDPEDEPSETTDPAEPINILDIGNNGTQFTGYLQDRFTLFNNKVTLTPGIRSTYFDVTGEFYFEPRFSVIIDLSEKIKLKGSWGKYYQFANNLVREDILQGDRNFWLLSDGENIPVSSAVHYIAGISYETKNFLFDVEAYYKDLKGMSEFAFRFDPRAPETDYTDYFYHGDGTAKGVEFLFQKKYGRYTGWICYTLGKVDYQFPGFGEDSFPASHDVTHEFKMVNSFKYKKWTLSATWIYATGKPYTQPLGAYQETIFNERLNREIVVDVIEYGPKNGARLPAYHRLDLSASLDFKLGNFDVNAGLSIFNVYNRNNIWRNEYDIADDELIVTEVTYMGITPSLFFKIRF